MTNNEIIKALECFKEERCQGDECPYYREDISCNVMMKDVYDLVHRQNAEIEKLKENQDTLTATLARSLAVKMSGGDPVAEIKTDAIIEFVKKLKDYYNNHMAYGKPTAYTDVGHIFLVLDDFLEEMVGTDNANS